MSHPPCYTFAMKMKNEMSYIETAKLTNIEVNGINRRDYPDFCDAYVEYCEVNGKVATEEELDYINGNMSHVAQEMALERCF